VALARSPTSANWDQIRLDPGGVLLVVTQGSVAADDASPVGSPVSLRSPAVLDEANRRLDGPSLGFVDWNQAEVRPIYQACVTYARLAITVATRTGHSNPDAAWAAALLAPLGWLGVCAVDGAKAAACLADPELSRDPSHAQQRYWGIDQGSIARRLSRRWQLPRWLAAVSGHLDLPTTDIPAIGTKTDLFHIVQMAVGLAQRHHSGLSLAVGATPEECANALSMRPADVAEIEREIGTLLDEPPPSFGWFDPQAMPLLPDLLVVAAQNRRLTDSPVLKNLENDVDRLHGALREQHAGEKQRLEASKLHGLAEFAAGAGHEINNPLAVISGQAQHLLNHEADPSRQRALQTVIAQAQRIHQILNDLMQFARPAKPQKQVVQVPELMREVTAALHDLATERRVRLTCSHPEHPVSFVADRHQMSAALSCLLRNAIEAAPADGWAGVRLETPTPDRLELVVEDNGNGLTLKQREHMFDPFFSGRSAGRGRGLGLATAWRLAREHGGEVRLDDVPRGPTRFVLSLPRGAVESAPPELNGHRG
jgi:signal transduction histidine kinase